MGLFPTIQDDAKRQGIDLSYKQIPIEVFDKRAVEKGEVVFHDVAYIEMKPIVKKDRMVSIELIDFCVFYNQGSIQSTEEKLRNGHRVSLLKKWGLLRQLFLVWKKEV